MESVVLDESDTLEEGRGEETEDVEEVGTASLDASAVKLTEAAVAVVTGSVVVLCGSKDIVVLPPSPPSTVEAEALALACDVLNACVVAFVVSPEKFESDRIVYVSSRRPSTHVPFPPTIQRKVALSFVSK